MSWSQKNLVYNGVTPIVRNRKFVLSIIASYFEHRSFLLTDEHTDVWVTQVSAVDLFVSASRIDVCKGLIDLQGPHPLIMHAVCGYTPLLAKWPQADSPVWTTWQALWGEGNRKKQI